MERTYLQWNVVNWITVILMASFGVMAIGLIASGLKAYRLPALDANSQG